MPKLQTNEASIVSKVLFSLKRGIHEADAIQIGSQLWLVPKWIHEDGDPEMLQPALMIRIDTLRASRMGDFLVLTDPLPIPVFEGRRNASAGYEIRKVPEIFVNLRAGVRAARQQQATD